MLFILIPYFGYYYLIGYRHTYGGYSSRQPYNHYLGCKLRRTYASSNQGREGQKFGEKPCREELRKSSPCSADSINPSLPKTSSSSGASSTLYRPGSQPLEMSQAEISCERNRVQKSHGIIRRTPHIRGPIVGGRLTLFGVILSTVRKSLGLPTSRPGLRSLTTMYTRLARVRYSPGTGLGPNPARTSGCSLSQAEGGGAPIALAIPQSVLAPPDAPIVDGVASSLRCNICPASSSRRPDLCTCCPHGT